MKLNHSKSKITILSILAICAYIFLISYSFICDIDDFYLGFNRGMNDNLSGFDEPKDIYYLSLNQKTGMQASLPQLKI